MIIDWYTTIFQIINFLVLVFLLRAFLYRPIIKAMDTREEIIMEREEDAATRKEQAEKEANEYRDQRAALEEEKEQILEEARVSAEKEKNSLLEKARSEVDQTRRRWEDAFEREKETFIGELRRRIGQQACHVARRCLSDLADASLEAHTWDLFIDKLKKLPEEEASALEKALTGEKGAFSLSSAFEPDQEKAEKLTGVLKELLSADGLELKPSLKENPDLVCGLELEAGGYRVAWNVDSYLEDVEEKILKELDHTAPAEEEVAEGDESRTD